MQAKRSFNPEVYKADDFGHKLHKLMYGVARDGYSGVIAGYTTMEINNNLTIHEKMFR